jgi:hypothetical protein
MSYALSCSTRILPLFDTCLAIYYCDTVTIGPHRLKLLVELDTAIVTLETHDKLTLRGYRLNIALLYDIVIRTRCREESDRE